MISFTTPGYVLRFTDIGSVDRIYSLYTKERGKIDALAKGIRKADSKLQSSVQFFAELEMYIIARRRFTLGGSVIRESNGRIQQSFLRMWVAQHALELVDRLTRQEHPDTSVFSLLQTFFLTLALQQKQKIERFFFASAWFDIHLLGLLGHAPRLFHTDMNKDADNWLLLQPDGLHRKSEKASYRQLHITPEDRTLLRFAQNKNIEDMFKVAVSPVQAIRQTQCTRVFLEEYDVLPLSSDTMFSTLQKGMQTSIS